VVRPPATTAPIVGLIDSGIASAHPLIGPAVLAAEALSPLISDGEDRNGHGTMVAGLLLHGPIPPLINRGLPTRPICKLLSVAVLDERALFPDERLWERDLVEALEWCATQGARIINLSLGDRTRPLRGPRQHPAAALVDEAARRLGLLVVVVRRQQPPGGLPARDGPGLCGPVP
jgi:subtilisin family serine protease